MRRRSLRIPAMLLAALLLPSAGFSAEQGSGDETVKWKDLAGGKAQIQFYGFLRTDVILDDSRPDSSQTPLYILSEDPAFGAADQSSFTLHPRLTRFGLNLKGAAMTALGGATPSGNLEMDFQNGGKETRPIIRIRHAYFKLSWRTLSFLVGQTWDVFGPVVPTVNNDSTMWNAGNVGDRRPQLRLSWDEKAGKGLFSLAGAAGLTDGVDPADLDNNGVRDGEASGRPNTQLRAGYSRPTSARTVGTSARTVGTSAGSAGVGAERKWSVGLSGLYAWHETATPIAGKDTFRTRAVALDYKLPLWKRISIQGEAWTGQNLPDFRGGINQGVNTTSGEEIASRGGWLEVGFKAGKSFLISPGYSIDDPRDRDVPAGTTQANAGRVQNRAWFVSNRWQPDPSFMVGIDFLRWITDYKAFESGVDNRVNAYFQYIF